MFYGNTMQYAQFSDPNIKHATNSQQLGVSQSCSSFELVSARTTMSPSLAMFSWVQYVQYVVIFSRHRSKKVTITMMVKNRHFATFFATFLMLKKWDET